MPVRVESTVLAIGDRLTKIGHELADARRIQSPKIVGLRDITRRVMESPTIVGDTTSGREIPRKRKVWRMATKITTAVVSRESFSTGTRGRKSQWNPADFTMNVGDILDVTDDFLAAAKRHKDSNIKSLKLVDFMSTDKESKGYKFRMSCLAGIRNAARKVNGKDSAYSLEKVEIEGGKHILGFIREDDAESDSAPENPDAPENPAE